MSQHELIAAKKKIAVARLVLRERRPPSPKLSVRLRPQHLRWEVGRYRDRIRSGPGGLGRAKIWIPERVGEQHNLVLDNAYELVPSHGFRNLTGYAAVGTGTSTPAATDTALAAEVARTNNVPAGESDSLTRIADGLYEQRRVREFSSAEVGGQNLGEWGWSPVSSAGANLAVRELFRDSGGSPIVISLTADQRLRLIYATQIQIQPVTAQTVSIAVTNLGTLSGNMIVALGNPGWGKGDLNAIDEFARGLGPTYAILHDTAISTSYSDTQYHNWKARVSYTFQPYVSGSRQRQTNQITFDESIIGTFWTIALGWYAGLNNVQNQAPPRIVLTSSFSKDNLHRLIFDPWTLTW